MKKLLIAIGIFLLIVIVGYVAFGRRSQSAQPVTPSALSDAETAAVQSLVHDCYQWYVGEYAQLKPPAVQQTPDARTTACFTPAFIAQWRRNTSGADPVLLAQDYYDSWTTSLQTAIVFAAPASVSVALTLGTNDETQKLLVHVIKVADVWQIAEVRTP